MNLSPLAHSVMVVAAEHRIQPGQELPERAFDLFLTHDGAGDALLELYSEGLLDDAGSYDVDRLTQKGFEYICQHHKAIMEA
ncbi:hypothetical protein ACSC89_003159 [Salmonella enterica subsp. enterica]|uniref:hypothetical protein n=1 Tax=Salmonella enterica TaxID=28901 RepID=UPI001DF0D31A|nr:hypothetical protein [Salmonella enterica subsp. enterica]EDW2262318.1 hypothetical protein [Salmonella enterica subsp. enterica serovar Langford]EEH9715090.1 hypothetical protein [Salmonella enterica subsp. enterica serovar Vancouver]HBZ6169013.1 hypothetical protein [Salmonella enterica]